MVIRSSVSLGQELHAQEFSTGYLSLVQEANPSLMIGKFGDVPDDLSEL